MGRAPCCDKANVKKGPWSPEEDAKLKSYIEQHGTGGNWIALPQKIGLKRCGKSCRLRWLNYLRPNIKHGGFSEEEDNIICSLYISIGSRWSVIAAQLPGRTDNDIKNYWNTRLKKKLLGKHRKEQQQQAQARNTNTNTNTNNRGHLNNRGIGNDNIGDSSSSSSLLPMVPENSTTPQQPYYCPVVLPPVPYTTPNNQLLGPSFNDQDSIRKLLIKLGGRFSDHDFQPPTTLLDGVLLMNSNNNNLDHQFPVVSPSAQEAHVNNNSNKVVQFSQMSNSSNQYCCEEVVQGQGGINNFSAAIGEEMVSNYPQRLLDHGGMEFFYGEDMVVTDSNKLIGTTAITTTTADNWGETYCSTKIYPETPQECVFQHYYPGPQ